MHKLSACIYCLLVSIGTVDVLAPVRPQGICCDKNNQDTAVKNEAQGDNELKGIILKMLL